MVSDKRDAELVRGLVEAAELLAAYRQRIGKLREHPPLAQEFLPAWVEPYLDTAKLCLILGGAVYFTTREPFGDQWGDDWNDAPYEHNAGRPYEFHAPIDGAKGIAPWEILRFGLWTTLVKPKDLGDGHDSRYSVQAVNRKAAPWLQPYPDPHGEADPRPEDRIWAGATIREVAELLHARNEALVVPPRKP